MTRYPWIGGWMGPTEGLDGCWKSTLPRRDWSRNRRARSKSLYWLRLLGPSITRNPKFSCQPMKFSQQGDLRPGVFLPLRKYGIFVVISFTGSLVKVVENLLLLCASVLSARELPRSLAFKCSVFVKKNCVVKWLYLLYGILYCCDSWAILLFDRFLSSSVPALKFY
jgi:hypothetical protein